MATEQDRLMIKRRAQSSFTIPILERPPIPSRFKRHPEDAKAWAEFEASDDRWRKTLGQQVASSVAAAIGSQGPTIITGGGGGVPGSIAQLEADLHAVYVMENFLGG